MQYDKFVFSYFVLAFVMSSVLIIFGSTGGNTELVTDKVAEVLTSQKHKVTVQRGELSSIQDIKPYDLVIFASPTYGHGLLQEHMVPIYRQMKKEGLKGKNCVVIGLGDNKYDKYYNIEAGVILMEGIAESSGKLFMEPLYVHKSPIPYLNTNITKWALKLAKKL